MQNNNPQLSIVVPFYNEEKNIPLVLNSYKRIKTSIRFELICVNNGSKDASQKIFAELLKQKAYRFAKVITIKRNKGYGYGILQGIKKTKGDIIAWTHADLQTDAKDVFCAYKVYRLAKKSQIVVKGRRTQRSFSAVFFSIAMAWIASILLKKIFYEINAQPKLFPRSFLKYFKNPPSDFSLDLYFLLVAKKYHYNILQIPVSFPPRKYGLSKWNYSFSSRMKTIKRTIEYIFTLREKQSTEGI